MPRISRTGDDRLIIAYNIRAKRKEQYATAGECAKKYKVPHSQWSMWESGKRTPDTERMRLLAKFFKCTEKDFFVPPENWEEEKAQMLLKLGVSVEEPIPEKPVENKKATNAAIDDGTKDYIQIVTMLAQVQSKFDKGEVDPATFNSKMQSIKEFVNFAHHSVMNERQPSE